MSTREERRPGSDATYYVLLGVCLAILPLKQVLTDWGWVGYTWTSAAAVLVPAALLRRRFRPAGWHLIPGLLLDVLILCHVFLRDTAVGTVLPGPAAAHQISQLITQLHQTSTSDVAPLHSNDSVRLLLCVVCAALAVLADLLVVELGQPALMAVPILAIYTVSGAIPRHTVNPVWFAAAGSGFLVLLAARNGLDVQRWGTVIRRPQSTASRVLSARDGRRIGVVAVLLTVLVCLALPSETYNRLANALHSGGGGGVAVSPLASLRGQLTLGTPVDLLQVHVSQDSLNARPFYLRGAVLDTFTGDGWVASGSDGAGEDLDTRPGLSIYPGSDVSRLDPFTATMTIQHLIGNAPLFGNPSTVVGLDGGWQWSQVDQVSTGGRLLPNDTYTEQVEQPDPTDGDLEQPTENDAALGRYTTDVSVSDAVSSLADRLTAGRTTAYDKTIGIYDYFADPANGFTYSLSTKPGDSGDDLATFLLTTKSGFCQQYAASMAVLLRLEGIPSRVVVGYTVPAPDAHGNAEITTHDAHAWVEAWLGTAGWVPFDPTPLSGADAARSANLAWAPRSGTVGNDAGDRAPIRSRTTSAAAPTSTPAPTTSTAPRTAARAAAGTDSGPLVGVAAVIALALLLGGPGGLRSWRRRRRMRDATHGAVEAAWAELGETCRDLGLGWSPTRTPRQVAHWLHGYGLVSSEADLRVLADLTERSRYRGDRPSRTDARQVAHATRAVLGELRRTVGGRARLLALVLPATTRARFGRRGRSVTPRQGSDQPLIDTTAG